jgi:hypothetical protein
LSSGCNFFANYSGEFILISDDTEGSGKLKPLSDFDIASSSRFICGGTELIDDDSFLLFWDVRSTSLLGGYWESHTDDITQVSNLRCDI